MVCLLPTFVYIPSHSGITAIFSAAALQSKKGQGQKKTSLSVYFFFSCRCCYSCKQKSRHPIIPVGERDRTLASQPPPLPSKKKKQNLARISSIKSMDCCESTPLQPTGTYSLTHSPMFGIPETLPYSETLFFLAFSFCLSFCLSVFLPCPATPNSKLCLSRPSQGLRFLSVLFSPPGCTTTLFHSFSRYRHQSITKPTAS